MSIESDFTPRPAEKPAIDDLTAKIAAVRPKKRIVTTVTVHAPGPDNVPFTHSDSGRITAGLYHGIAYSPGWPVELDATEADKLLAKHGGEVVGDDYELPPGTPEPVETRRVE